MTEWQPIETAPKDGTIICLLFPPQSGFVRHGGMRRMDLDRRETNGKWWTPDALHKRVGKRAEAGARGALLQKHGGFWGMPKKSHPLAGWPSHWKPMQEQAP